MEYNSQKEHLIMPEYGRNVQLMVDYAKSIEDRALRQAFAEEIIKLMHQMNPQNRSLDEQRTRLWKHIFRIAQYDLDVDTPTGEKPTPESDRKKPERVDYPDFEARFRHYGHHVQTLIKKAREMEDGSVKTGLINVIGNYMKLAYQTWNREHYVSDEVIKSDLTSLSDGELSLKEDASLDNLSSPSRRPKRRSYSNGGSGSKQGGRSKGKRRK
jgi:hypothetical protein